MGMGKVSMGMFFPQACGRSTQEREACRSSTPQTELVLKNRVSKKPERGTRFSKTLAEKRLLAERRHGRIIRMGSSALAKRMASS